MTSKTTIHDIARVLKTTASTVSRALNDHPSISDATKKAVHKTAQKLQYRPNRIASSLRLGKSRILGVIIPSAEINFFGSVVHGIEKVANENGYNVLLYQSNELPEFEKKGVETFLRSRVDGVLASIAKETMRPDHYLEIKKRGIPLILFDRSDDDLGLSSVVINDYKGAYKATEHLVLQGCRRIAHIAGQQHVPIFQQRLRGYVDALRSYDLPIDENLIIYGKVTVASGRECTAELLNRGEIIDGIFAVEDFTALGAMQALKNANRNIPDDVALIGFANEAFSEFITPSLSTIDQQTIKMGEEAARLFFELSARKDFYEIVVKKVLEPLPIFRESSLKKH